MELGYDGEELGYEEGYGRVLCHSFTSQEKLMSEEEIAPFGYQCEPPSGSPNVLNRTPSVFPSVVRQSIPQQNNTNTNVAPRPLLPGGSSVSVPPAKILKILPGGSTEAKSSEVTGQQPTLPAPISPKEAQRLTGAPDPNQKATVPNGDKAYSLGSYRVEKELRTELKKKFGDDASVNDYMKRFEKFEAGPKRENAMRYFLSNRVWEKEGTATQEKPQPKPVQASSATPSLSKEPPELKKLDTLINNLPPTIRPQAEQLRVEGSRSILFHTLTGKQFDPSRPVNIPQTVKTIQPPLTREEALAYMQSKKLTDAEGNPRKDVSAGSFISDAFSVQEGKLDRKSIVAWERQEIVKVLSSSPYNKKGPEIIRLMNSKGWLGDNSNIAMMESFRHKAAEGKDVAAIQAEVKAADVKGNDLMGVEEKDRADVILENLGPKKKGKEAALAAQTREARAGRELQRSEGQAQRDMNLKVATMKEEGDTRRHQESLKAQKEENETKRAFDEKQSATQRKHDAEQREKDRKAQLVNALLSFIGGLLNTAIQSVTSAGSAAIQGMTGLSGQIVGSIKHGGR